MLAESFRNGDRRCVRRSSEFMPRSHGTADNGSSTQQYSDSEGCLSGLAAAVWQEAFDSSWYFRFLSSRLLDCGGALHALLSDRNFSQPENTPHDDTRQQGSAPDRAEPPGKPSRQEDWA